MTDCYHSGPSGSHDDEYDFTLIEKADSYSEEGMDDEGGEEESGGEHDGAGEAGSTVDQYFEADEQVTLGAQPEKRAPLQRHDAACQLCMEGIRGERWMCLECGGWSLCGDCFQSLAEEVHPHHTFVRARSADDLYKPVSARKMMEAPVVHLDVLCSSCQAPILGPRYECIADAREEGTSFCQACECHPLGTHDPSHPIVLLKVPREMSAVSSILCVSREAGKREQERFARINRPFKRAANKGLWAAVDEGSSPSIERVKPCRNYRMEIKLDKESRWGSAVKPGTTFNRSWNIVNIGSLPWPKGTAVVRVSHAIFPPILFSKKPLADDVVQVGGTAEVRFVGFQAPKQCGTYTEVWALCNCDDQLFGERLEIRLTVGDNKGDKHASDRYYGLKEALKEVPDALRGLEKEQEEALSQPKHPLQSSTLLWDGIEQTFACTWQLKECDYDRKECRLPGNYRLRRLHRGGRREKALPIDDFSCVVSLSSTVKGLIEISNLKLAEPTAQKVLTTSTSKRPTDCNEGPSPTSEMPDHNRLFWFDEIWTLVDKTGAEVGQRFCMSNPFTCFDFQEQGQSTKKLHPYIRHDRLEEKEE